MLKDKAIYSVKHFVASRPLGEFSAFIPVEHFVSSNKKPSISQVVKALKIDYEPSKGESITIHSLHVIPIDSANSAFTERMGVVDDLNG